MTWPVAAIVAENGAVMLRRDGDALRRDFTQDESTRAAHFQRLQRCAQAVLAAVPGACLARDSAGRLTDIAIDHSEFAHLDDAQIEAVLAVMHAHGLNASVSSIHVNGWLGAHDKWSGARWAVPQALGVGFDAAEWLYVGDSSNDQLMFEQMPLSVAVANIARFVPQLSVLPAYVTPSERGRGFAEVVQRLLAAKRRHDAAGRCARGRHAPGVAAGRGAGPGCSGLAGPGALRLRAAAAADAQRPGLELPHRRCDEHHQRSSATWSVRCSCLGCCARRRRGNCCSPAVARRRCCWPGMAWCCADAALLGLRLLSRCRQRADLRLRRAAGRAPGFGAGRRPGPVATAERGTGAGPVLRRHRRRHHCRGRRGAAAGRSAAAARLAVGLAGCWPPWPPWPRC